MIPLTASETDAVLYLAEHEVVKVAADKRCVSEHTEKNQIKSAMGQTGCNYPDWIDKRILPVDIWD